ncbi:MULTISPECIES: DUF6528 family protein [unclassified Variovorax]|uniref:DUF6528 family protein n=1 Tax=unclassified Variovorax TaxID=663243 RepID=UPI003F457A43
MSPLPVHPAGKVRAALFLASALLFGASSHGAALLACGSDAVRKYEVDGDRSTVTWSWSARTDGNMPEAYKSGLFDKIDECKPVLDASAVLVTASTGGVALVDLQTGHATFWAQVAMAHSAEMLPGHRIAVAASLAPQGNRIEIYDANLPGRMLHATELYSGHGVVWDERRSLLYALGHEAVRAYKLADWDPPTPRLALVASWPLPGKADGHDLARLPGDRELVLSTDDGVWQFDPDTGVYAAYAPLAGRRNIKAVSVEARTGRIAFQQPEERWWSHHIRLLAPEGAIAVPDIRLYKVRWLPDHQAP